MIDSINNPLETLREECNALYEKISNNQEQINDLLSAFSVGESYSNHNTAQEGLRIPGDSLEYNQAILTLQNNIDDMNEFIDKQKLLKQYAIESNSTEYSSQITSFEEIAHEYEILKEEREDTIQRLSDTRDIIDTIPEAIAHSNENSKLLIPTDASTNDHSNTPLKNTSNVSSNGSNTNMSSSANQITQKSDFHSTISFPEYS